MRQRKLLTGRSGALICVWVFSTCIARFSPVDRIDKAEGRRFSLIWVLEHDFSGKYPVRQFPRVFSKENASENPNCSQSIVPERSFHRVWVFSTRIARFSPIR
jgi:hypothetical protein